MKTADTFLMIVATTRKTKLHTEFLTSGNIMYIKTE